MGMDITFYGAFLAGIISFLSPCILPIIPPYICFLAGMSLDQVTGQEETDGAGRKIMFSAVAFVIGFGTVFVLLGASASFLGQALTDYFDVLKYFAGAVIIMMGLHFLGVFRISMLYRQAKIEVQKKPAGIFGAYLVGLAFAFGWTPCVGPILASILFVAGAEDSATQGALLLGAYAAGIGIPFLFAAAFAGPFVAFMRKFSKHMATVEKVMGIMLIITGVLIMTGYMQELGFFLQGLFPSLAVG